MNPDLLTFKFSLMRRSRPRCLVTDPFSSSIPSWGDVPEADSETVPMAPLRRRPSCFFDDGPRSEIRERDLADIQRKYAIHPSVGMRSPSNFERTPEGGANELAVYEAYIESGFRGGRLKINPEVLQNMREYILASEGGERSVRKERVKKSVRQKTILRLEPPPKITTDVNKDKGIVFNVSGAEEEQRKTEKNDSIDGMRNASRFTPGGVREFQVAESGYSGSSCQSFFECPTGFSAGMVSARSSGYLFLKEWEDVKGLQRG
ncbi:hypothetical protein DY000_02039900 [Brassica cretica]|uniref:DUF3741 domain-containing protein n=2 Tax=Brassica cretica TaxID=69181 RepID=A0ABQ7BA90_BRACR|nr:hypothetical protein DY000_02039900 [Brassica cretica]